MRWLSILYVLIWAPFLMAQKPSMLPLQTAYDMAIANYPLVGDIELIDKIQTLNLTAIKRRGLPDISLNGKAQAQTENIVFPFGSTTLEAPLETWSSFLGVDYHLYDGGTKKAQKTIEIASAQIARTIVRVEQRTLKDRVNILIFAIELSRQQNSILETSKADLNTNIASLKAGFENGIVLESEVNKLKVRQLELISETIEIKGNIETYFKLLEQLLGNSIPRDTKFILPKKFITEIDKIKRPEQTLFNNQKLLFEAYEAVITAKTLPKISFFAQGGVGNPNPLNFTDFNMANYALGGVRLKWNFYDFGSGKKEKQSLRLQQEQVEIDRELFLFDVDSKSKEYEERIKTLELQIKNDETIVSLQADILKQSQVQLENGVISSNDYVIQFNATINAKQQLEFNKIQLQQTTINYLTLTGEL